MKLFFTVLAAFLISNAHASGNPARVYMDQALGVDHPGTVCTMPPESVQLMGFVTGQTPAANQITVSTDAFGGMGTTPDTIFTATGTMIVNPTAGNTGIFVNQDATGVASGLVVNQNGTTGGAALEIQAFTGAVQPVLFVHGNVVGQSCQIDPNGEIEVNGSGSITLSPTGKEIINAGAGMNGLVVTGASGVAPLIVNEVGGGGAGSGLQVVNSDPTQQTNLVLSSPLTAGGTDQITFSDLGGGGESFDMFMTGSSPHYTVGMFFDAAGTQPLTLDSPTGTPGRLQTPYQQYQGQGVAPNLSDAGNASIYFDTGSNQLMLSLNGGAYAQIATGTPGADVHLSNLVAPTAVPVDLLPSGNLMQSLGSNTNAWGTSYIGAMFNPAGSAAVFWNGTNFDPGTDGVINLGEATNRWNNIRAANNVFTSTLVAGFWQDPTLTNQIGWSGASILPNATDTVILGSPSFEYKQFYVGTSIASAGFDIATSGAQPTCVVGVRGLQWVIQGGAGVADIYQICEKNAADMYVWVSH